MEPLQYCYSSFPVSQRVKFYAPSQKHLFKRNLLLAKDTKHIQQKRTLNAKYRMFWGAVLSSPVDLYLN